MVELKPKKELLTAFPEYKGKRCVFLGWDARQNKTWSNFLIRVKIGDGRIEYLDPDWFKDLKL